jgi:hypothetical protein
MSVTLHAELSRLRFITWVQIAQAISSTRIIVHLSAACRAPPGGQARTIDRRRCVAPVGFPRRGTSYTNAFVKLKALLRKATERSVDGLRSAIGRVIDYSPKQCKNYFNTAGYLT